MYESFFGLSKRPFTAMPDAGCFVPLEGIYQAYSSLMQCAVDGRGIGVLAAPAGLGKTLVCQRLAHELDERFTVVYLPTGNFFTRRSLLQAILFELGHSYVRMGDQELRSALTSMIRRLRPGRGTIALIVDEAHLLAPRMLEELRTLTNFAEGGESLLRLVVSGHLSLEETLSQPSLDAFNQRIGIQTTLEPLTREESAQYVTRRLALAGANVTGVLTSDSLAMICEAADGSPRCLNQLCDHSLLLGYLGSQKPVSYHTVREALNDLKQLPLNWNQPVTHRGEMAASPLAVPSKPARMFEDEEAWIVTPDEPMDADSLIEDRSAIEYGADDEIGFDGSIEIGGPTMTAAKPIEMTIAAPAALPAAPAMKATKGPAIAAAVAAPVEAVDEEIVIDRYAALDAALSRLTRTMLCARAVTRRGQPVASAPAKAEPAPIADEETIVSSRFDVVLPEETPAAANTAAEREVQSRSESPAGEGGSRLGSGRRYERLFSELRRRRIGA